MKYVLSLGEMLIDLIPTTQLRLGETCYAPHPGGAPANVAVAIARLGGASRFIGRVSEDLFGQLLVQVLADNHVDIQYVRTVKGASTTLALVTLQADGQRQFTFFRQGTGDTQLRAEDLERRAWHDAAICHVGSVLFSSESARSATLTAIEQTRQIGALVSCDVNIRPPLRLAPTGIRDSMAKIVQHIDIFKLSAEDAAFLGADGSWPMGQPDSNWLNTLGEALVQQGPTLVIITLGAQGALLFTASHHVEVPARSISPVDTTGAGDAFMGAVLYKLAQQGCHTPSDLQHLSEHELSSLGNFANQVAGLSCTRYGGLASLPFIHEVNDLSAP